MPTRTLTVFLARTGFTNFGDFLTDEARGNLRRDLTPGRNFTGAIYLAPQSKGTPEWIDFLNEGAVTPLPRRISASVSAVMVLKHEDRLFAFTFGHGGRGMLLPGAFETDFGLKVVLNRVDVNQLRSVDTKNFEDVVVNTRKQTSRSSQLGAFGLDVSRDLLRGVVGDPTDKTFFKRIAGSEAAVFTTDREFEDLGDVCAELLAAYEDNHYQQNFPWVDRVKQVRVAALAATLDDLLIQAIRQNATGSMHLAPGRVIDWEKVEHFAFGGTGNRQAITYQELTLRGYLDTLGPVKRAQLDIAALQRHDVRVKYTNTAELESEFTVYQCIVWDVTHAGDRYVLMDGDWFKVETNFATRTLADAAALHVLGPFLIPAQSGQSEGKYNISVGVAHPQYAVLDTKNIKTDDMASSVECCDLFSDQGEFIHVKKRSSSATLSHLFSQGSVSAELFVQSSAFRDEIRSKLNAENKVAHAALIPQQSPNTSQFRVTFAIIAHHDPQGNPPPLPFFSAVNLVQHHRRLRGMGLAVGLRYIRTV